MRSGSVRLLALTVTLWAGWAAASPFRDWRQAFRHAELPDAARLAGYWAGRCATKDHPKAVMPALYVYRTRTDCTDDCDTQSFYAEPGSDPAKFDQWTITQVKQDKATGAWLQGTDWNPVYTADGAIDNQDGTDGDSDPVRAVRASAKAANAPPAISLRLGYFPLASTGDTYCRFDTALSDTPPPPPPPVHPPHWIGDTGPSEGGILTVANQSAGDAFSSVQFANQGPAPIQIWDIAIELASGEVLSLPDRLKLPAGASGSASFSNAGDKVKSVQFFLYGTAQNVQLTGLPNGS
jgi:hypothetical protein